MIYLQHYVQKIEIKCLFNEIYDTLPIKQKTMNFYITLFASNYSYRKNQYDLLMKYTTHDKLKDFCRRTMMDDLFPDKISAITFTDIKEFRGQITIYFDITLN